MGTPIQTPNHNRGESSFASQQDLSYFLNNVQGGTVYDYAPEPRGSLEQAEIDKMIRRNQGSVNKSSSSPNRNADLSRQQSHPTQRSNEMNARKQLQTKIL